MTPQQQTQLETIRTFPDTLTRLVAPLSDEQLQAQPIDGEWSVAQIVHHTADSHMNSFIRLKLILTEDNPPLKPYAEPLWARTADVTAVSIDASLTLLRGLHERWVALFSSLQDDEWRRTGFHSELGTNISPTDLLASYAQHCTAHLEQLERTLHAQ